jgi:uncharacterized protein DUF4153
MSLTGATAGGAASDGPRAPWAIWGCAIGLALVGTALLYAASPGVNWPMFVAAVSLVLLALSGPWEASRMPGVYVPLTLACFMALGAAFTADASYEFLIAGGTLFALATAIISASNEVPAPGETGPSVLAAPYAAALVVREATRRTVIAKLALRDGRGIPAARGVALAVPVIVALALLLSQADPILGHAREALFEAFRDLSVLPRAMVCCALAVCLLGAFGIAAKSGPAAEQALEPAAMRETFGDTERLIVTGAIASLFTLFLALQVSYLFGNPGGRMGSGVSYADAVHRGFAELNIAASVCAVVLFALRRFASAPQRPRLVQALEWLVVAEAQILLASAFYRVDLYEAAYGYTRLRLFVQVYAAVASVALCLLLLELRTRPDFDRLLRRILVVCGVTLSSLVLMNADSWIAQRNLQRYAGTGQLDALYLTQGLGPDAVPALVGALPRLPAATAARIASCLRARYPEYPGRYAAQWFEWSRRRVALSRAMAALQSVATTLPEDGCTGP